MSRTLPNQTLRWRCSECSSPLERLVAAMAKNYCNGQTSISIGTATRMTNIDSGKPSRG